MEPRIISKLDLGVILDPHPTNPNLITGTLPGEERAEIKVWRRFRGWTPMLTISVNGHTIHSAEATKDQQQQFDELESRARDRDKEDRVANRALNTAKAANLWVDAFK